MAVLFLFLQMPDWTLDTVRVLGTRLAPGFSETMSSVWVMDSAWLKPFPHLGGALRFAPGLWLRERGLPRVQGDLGTGPGNYTQTAVLVNGVRLEDPQTPHHNLDLPMDIADLERVDVARGGASALVGPGASGGAVNLVTRDPRRGVRATGFAGSFGTGGAALDLGNGTLGAGLWSSRSDGYRPGSDYEKWGLSTRARAMGFKVFAGYSRKGFGARDFYAPYPSREWTSSALFTLARGNLSLGLRRHTDRFVLLEEDPSFYENHHTKTSGICTYGTLLGPGFAGAELSWWELRSDRLGYHQAPSAGVFYQARASTGKLILALGLREDWREGTGLATSAGAGLLWGLQGVSAWLRGSRATRFPSATEMFYEDPGNLGNPGLRPEASERWETGLSLRGLELSVFWVRFQDLIDWVRTGENGPWEATNLEGVSARGLSVELKSGWLFGAYTLQHMTSPGDIVSKYALRAPHQSIKLGTRYGFLSWEDGVCLVSGNLLIRRGRWWGRLFGDNLLNQSYEDIPGLPGPGRSLGIQISGLLMGVSPGESTRE